MKSRNLICRLRIIHECLASKHKRYWSIEDFIQEVSEKDIVTARRTIEDDIRMMRYDERLAYFAPIEYCRKNKGYYYADDTFCIPFSNTTHEVHQILNVLASVVDHCNAYITHSITTMSTNPTIPEENYAILVMQALDLMNALRRTISPTTGNDPDQGDYETNF